VTGGAWIGWRQDEDGVVVLTLDAPVADANRFSADFSDVLEQVVERIETTKDQLSGIVIASTKSSFCLDSDPSGVLRAERTQAGALSAVLARDAALLRRLELCGRPVVATIAGDAVGDGFALALAAHRRLAVDEPTFQLGLPQVRLGLLPGRGGLTRVVRLLGISEALTEVLLEGKLLGVERCAKLGLIDELVESPDALLPAAKAWIAAGGAPRQPWDREDYRMPGGTPSSARLAQFLPAYPANLRKQLRGANFPAPRHIMAATVEGAQLDLDGAVTVETRYLVDLMCGQVAKNMVQAFHVDLAQAEGRRRAAGAAPFRPQRVAVLGDRLPRGGSWSRRGLARRFARGGRARQELRRGRRRPRSRARTHGRGRRRGGARADYADRLAERSRRRGSGDRGSLRGRAAQGRCAARDRRPRRSGRADRFQHLDASDNGVG
jgi:3-hydroxyacyl-CoA dehydrogenase/enoyl-CoA hydratase/3-hydroxybutyryl-CoA epimerase